MRTRAGLCGGVLNRLWAQTPRKSLRVFLVVVLDWAPCMGGCSLAIVPHLHVSSPVPIHGHTTGRAGGDVGRSIMPIVWVEQVDRHGRDAVGRGVDDVEVYGLAQMEVGGAFSSWSGLSGLHPRRCWLSGACLGDRQWRLLRCGRGRAVDEHRADREHHGQAFTGVVRTPERPTHGMIQRLRSVLCWQELRDRHGRLCERWVGDDREEPRLCDEACLNWATGGKGRAGSRSSPLVGCRERRLHTCTSHRRPSGNPRLARFAKNKHHVAVVESSWSRTRPRCGHCFGSCCWRKTTGLPRDTHEKGQTKCCGLAGPETLGWHLVDELVQLRPWTTASLSYPVQISP